MRVPRISSRCTHKILFVNHQINDVVWVPSHVLFAVWGATRIRRVLIRTVAGVQSTSVYKGPTM
jgi:hypothetical protein